MNKRIKGWNSIAYLLVLLVVLFILSGCGSSNNNEVVDNTNNNNTGEGTTTAAGDPTQGEIVYTNNCLPCHGKGGENGNNGPNLKTSAISQNPDQIYDRVMNGQGSMPSFKDSLSEVQIQDVVAYINQVVANK